jgi:hypothetical protein
MENTIILQGTTPEAIAKTVCDMFESRFEDFKKDLLTRTENEDLLTREQVLELLQINASTLWHWQNKGRIIVHKFANKCYYKRSEIMASLIPLKK